MFERTCMEEVELEAGFDLTMHVAYTESYSVKEVSITDKKGKEIKSKKNLSEELKGELEPVLVSPPLQSPILGD
ncbi:hypothetical protein DUI87_17964 [Hirundo rustica rustica]|uniref:Uncharacterized protein n=1 Tax=Hirundo rustica rustica TaxID=333673 RepID=A0A3M0JUX1_HIRRU|nr:hypothetical protein DUI87_17964 [Hirundo rustica rustica]